MTNTRTTDVEILEKRYPIILREFSIRRGSGGEGEFNGGCGVVRDWECRLPLTFTMISERRVHRPYGMEGGQEGALGANYWVKKQPDGSYRWLNIGSRGQVDLAEGDRYVIHTPGGGGWGRSQAKSGIGSTGTNARSNERYARATGSLQSMTLAQETAS